MALYDAEQMVYGKKHFKDDAEFQGRATFTGGKRLNGKAVTAAYTFTDTDGIEFLLVTTGATAMTMTLPTAKDNTGRTITIRKMDTGAGKITVDGEGSETIDGNLTVGIWYVNNFLTFLCTGTAWLIVGAPQPFMIPHALRASSWELSAGTAAAFTDAWGVGVANPYVPTGVKSLVLEAVSELTATNAAEAYVVTYLRKNGSTEAAGLRTNGPFFYISPAVAGCSYRHSHSGLMCACDANGIVEYQVTPANGVGKLYLTTVGYSMMG